MLEIKPGEHPQPEIHRLLLGGVAPRPIALVSTVSEDGTSNLSPFSFFNAFGSNPPIVAFSPSRRGRDATFKDTYSNLIKTRECVIQSVTYNMVEQVNLASTEFPPGVDEFIKSGLTPLESVLVKPKRVKESPFQMECILRDMNSYGEGGAAANIAVCEVVLFHISEDIIRDGLIQPDLIDLVARMAGNYYSRASGDSVFKVAKPAGKKGIGFDNLPEFIKNSFIYTANNLARFANIEKIPSNEEVDQFIYDITSLNLTSFEEGEEAFRRYEKNRDIKKMLKCALMAEDTIKRRMFLEITAKNALEIEEIDFAWKTAVFAGRLQQSAVI